MAIISKVCGPNDVSTKDQALSEREQSTSEENPEGESALLKAEGT